MRRPRHINRANLLGIFLLGLFAFAVILQPAPSPFEIPERLVTEPSFLEEWWNPGQGNFWLGKIPQHFSPERREINSLISWRADPNAWSSAEITDLSYFIQQKSREYEMSPILLLSLIEVESGYRVTAVSRRGAVGLMQLLPATAQEIAEDIGLRWPGPDILVNPKANIEFGLRYLAALKQQFSGLEHVLTAYNIGPRALKRKLRNGDDISLAYFERVMGTMRAYEGRSRVEQSRPGLWATTWL